MLRRTAEARAPRPERCSAVSRSLNIVYPVHRAFRGVRSVCAWHDFETRKFRLKPVSHLESQFCGPAHDHESEKTCMAERPRYPSPAPPYPLLPARECEDSANLPHFLHPVRHHGRRHRGRLCDYSRPCSSSVRQSVAASREPRRSSLRYPSIAIGRRRLNRGALDRPLRRSPRDAPSDSSSFPILPACNAGLTPPWRTQSPRSSASGAKFVEAQRTLATDGFIVYDIQEEKGHTPEPRPFPFRKLDDPSHFARCSATSPARSPSYTSASPSRTPAGLTRGSTEPSMTLV